MFQTVIVCLIIHEEIKEWAFRQQIGISDSCYMLRSAGKHDLCSTPASRDTQFSYRSGRSTALRLFRTIQVGKIYAHMSVLQRSYALTLSSMFKWVTYYQLFKIPPHLPMIKPNGLEIFSLTVPFISLICVGKNTCGWRGSIRKTGSE